MGEHVRALQSASNRASKHVEQELNSVKHRVMLLEKIARNAALARNTTAQQLVTGAEDTLGAEEGELAEEGEQAAANTTTTTTKTTPQSAQQQPCDPTVSQLFPYMPSPSTDT